jgi:hypothetical protein
MGKATYQGEFKLNEEDESRVAEGLGVLTKQKRGKYFG